MASQATSTELDPYVQGWVEFIERIKDDPVQKPYPPVATLICKYLITKVPASILDVGCEIGKNAIPLIEAGHKVTLLDVAPNAIECTRQNIRQRDLEAGIAGSIAEKIEVLDPKHGPFDAVVGTFAFSFIPPHLFDEVMKNNVLGRVKEGGYFAGGFFGEKHAWASNPELTIVTVDKIKTFFSSMNFSICEMNEKTEELPTVFDGIQIFHTIEVIAVRTLLYCESE